MHSRISVGILGDGWEEGGLGAQISYIDDLLLLAEHKDNDSRPVPSDWIEILSIKAFLSTNKSMLSPAQAKELLDMPVNSLAMKIRFPSRISQTSRAENNFNPKLAQLQRMINATNFVFQSAPLF